MPVIVVVKLKLERLPVDEVAVRVNVAVVLPPAARTAPGLSQLKLKTPLVP